MWHIILIISAILNVFLLSTTVFYKVLYKETARRWERDTTKRMIIQ